VGWFGALTGVAGIVIVAASALFGAVVTVLIRHDPGTVLGVVVLAGTVVACLAVRARSVRLLIPAPTLCYVPAAVIAGAVNDRATDTSHTMDLVNAGSWIANGFLMMALATVAAIVFTALRLYLDWRYRSQPRRDPRLPAGGNRAGAPASGPDSDACGNCGAPLDLDLNGRCRWCYAPRGARRPGLDPAEQDKTRPIGSTGAYRPQASGPYPASDASRPQENGRSNGQYRAQDTGPARSQGNGSYRPSAARPARPQIAGPSRPQIAGPAPTQDSAPYRSQDSGPYRSQDSAPYRSQDSGPYQEQNSGPYGAYPESADLVCYVAGRPLRHNGTKLSPSGVGARRPPRPRSRPAAQGTMTTSATPIPVGLSPPRDNVRDRRVVRF
jgi:hypothetical protein